MLWYILENKGQWYAHVFLGKNYKRHHQLFDGNKEQRTLVEEHLATQETVSKYFERLQQPCIYNNDSKRDQTGKVALRS